MHGLIFIETVRGPLKSLVINAGFESRYIRTRTKEIPYEISDICHFVFYQTYFRCFAVLSTLEPTPRGGTQLRVGYGCAARSFDHHPITNPEKTQICYLYLNHSFLEGPFLKPISAFYNVNWDA